MKRIFKRWYVLLNVSNFNFFFKVKTKKLKAITGTMEKLIKITEGDHGGMW